MHKSACRIDLVTTARSDFTVWLPIYRALAADSALSVRFVVTGPHFLTSLGKTHKEVKAEIPDGHRVELPIRDVDDPDVYLPEMLAAYSQHLVSGETDLVCLLGDRFELMPMLSAAILRGVPLAHFFGGEMDIDYCLDTQVRNAITKAAHIHFVAHQDNAKRLVAMGEEEWRIAVAGEPASATAKPDGDAILEFLKKNKVPVAQAGLVSACYLPPTMEKGLWKSELDQLLEALDAYPQYTFVWTGVNADPDGIDVKKHLEEACKSRGNHVYFDHLGGRLFNSLLSQGVFMVGNSSSGLREAAHHRLPVVNVGTRQVGRLHGPNVVDSRATANDVKAAIKAALKMDRSGIKNVFENPSFAKDITAHLHACLGRKELRVKRLPALKYELQRVPEPGAHQDGARHLP